MDIPKFTGGYAGGYDYEFVDKPLDIFVCKICHLPSRDPHLSICCGHIFCKLCLDNAKKVIATHYYYNVHNLCPMCRTEEFATVPNKQIYREVRSLQIFCTNKVKGCMWQGEVSTIGSHLEHSDGCQFETVNCFNECGMWMQRQYLPNHVDIECPQHIIKCQYCSIKGKRQFITETHGKECPKFPLSCPNGCGIYNIPREDIDKHRDTCPHENVHCYNLCGKEMQRQYLNHHAEAECPRRTVTCQYCCSLTEHQFIDDHKMHCHKFPLPCPNDCGIEDIPREDIFEHRNTCPLEIIHCTNKCGEEMIRQQLDYHLEDECPRRNACCQYCNIEGEHQFILGEHIEKCQKYPLLVPMNVTLELSVVVKWISTEKYAHWRQ